MYSYFHWSAQHQFNPLTHPQLFNPRREWINDKIWQNILFSKYLFFSSRIKDGFKKNQQRVERHRQWSTSSVQRGSSWRWSFPLASNHPGTSRLSIRRRSVLPQHTLPHRLPLQTSQICIHHANLPSKHQQQRSNLPRHPQISVVTSSHRIKGVTVHMLSVVWPQPRWSSSSRDRQVIQDWCGEV